MIGTALFMGTMFVGGVTANAMKYSANNINNYCKEYTNALKEYEKATQEWTNEINKAETTLISVENANLDLASKISNYKVTLGYLKDEFRTKYFSVLVGLCIFVFTLIVSLLLKYYNVIPNIWNYFVK